MSFCLLASLVVVNAAAQSDSEAFEALLKKDWEFRMQEFPSLARDNDNHDSDGQIAHVSEKDQLRRYNFWKQIQLEQAEISCERLGASNVSTTECSSVRYASF